MSKAPKVELIDYNGCRHSTIFHNGALHCILKIKDPDYPTSYSLTGKTKDCPWHKEKK